TRLLQRPEPYRLVFAARGKPLPVGAEGDTVEATAMTLEGLRLGAQFHVPQPDRIVLAAAGEPLAIGPEDHAAHGGPVFAQGGRITLQRADADQELVAACGQALAIGAEGDCVVAIAPVAEGCDRGGPWHLPRQDGPVAGRNNHAAVRAERHARQLVLR